MYLRMIVASYVPTHIHKVYTLNWRRIGRHGVWNYRQLDSVLDVSIKVMINVPIKQYFTGHRWSAHAPTPLPPNWCRKSFDVYMFIFT